MNPVKNQALEVVERRCEARRQTTGRRAEDLVEVQCGLHNEVLKRLESRCDDRKEQQREASERQEKINVAVTGKIDAINTKLNWLMGACFILWPIVQIGFQYLMGKK